MSILRLPAVVLVAMVLTLGMAEESPAQEQSAPCLRPHPKPECSGFMILEFGYAYRLTSVERDPDHGHWSLPASVGYLANVSPKHSVGVDLHAAFEDDGSNFAVRGRYRWWIEPNVATDVAVGPLFAASGGGAQANGDPFLPDLPGLTATLGMEYEGLLGASLRYDFVPSEGEAYRSEWFVGVHGSSWVGFLAGLVVAGVLFVTLSTSDTL